jgi:hypothetical protein
MTDQRLQSPHLSHVLCAQAWQRQVHAIHYRAQQTGLCSNTHLADVLCSAAESLGALNCDHGRGGVAQVCLHLGSGLLLLVLGLNDLVY